MTQNTGMIDANIRWVIGNCHVTTALEFTGRVGDVETFAQEFRDNLQVLRLIASLATAHSSCA